MANEDQTREQEQEEAREQEQEERDRQEDQTDERYAESAGIAGGHEESGHDPDPEHSGVDEESSRPSQEGGDRTAMTGTLDTTQAGVPAEDVRTVSGIFRDSDERAAKVAEESRNQQAEADSDSERQANEQREASRKQAHDEKVRAGLAEPDKDEESEEGRESEEDEESRGTTVAGSEAGTQDPGVADATGAEQGEEFDPAEHGVDDVNAYLESLPEDPEGQQEYDRVLEAERQGKARKGILND